MAAASTSVRTSLPAAITVLGCALLSFMAGLAFSTTSDEPAVQQMSRLRGDGADIYTREALRKALAKDVSRPQ